jgi:hypothetical protein
LKPVPLLQKLVVEGCKRAGRIGDGHTSTGTLKVLIELKYTNGAATLRWRAQKPLREDSVGPK